MSFADWEFSEQSAPAGKREWRMSNPADPGQVFYCYAERVKRRDGSEHWRRRYGRTSASPDMPIADMEEIFRAAYQAHKEKA